MNEELAERINRMAERDQAMRRQMKQGGQYDESLDRVNTEELKNIVRTFGWPTIQLVGEEASHNAWLLAQHADHDVSFQKEVLEFMRRAYRQNPQSVKKENITYLWDRILCAEGKEQEFGTQLHRSENGIFVPEPIREPEKVDERRVAYGLISLGEYMANAKKYLYGRDDDKR